MSHASHRRDELRRSLAAAHRHLLHVEHHAAEDPQALRLQYGDGGRAAGAIKLEANFQGRRTSRRQEAIPFDTGIRREHNVIEALAAVLRFFDGEEEIVRTFQLYDSEFHVLFDLEYPLRYAFITVGVRDKFWETWTYGRKSEVRNEQLRRCRQDALCEISQALRSTRADGAKSERSDGGTSKR